MMFTPYTTARNARAGAMRHVHGTLRTRAAALLAAPDDVFVRDFPAFVDEVEAGFRHEEALLEPCGDDELRACRADNATILCALHRVLPRVERGEVALGRQVTGALLDLLGLHRLRRTLMRWSIGRAAFAGHLRHPAWIRGPGPLHRRRWPH